MSRLFRRIQKGSVIIDEELDFESGDQRRLKDISTTANMNYLRELAKKESYQSNTSGESGIQKKISAETFVPSDLEMGTFTALGEKHNTNEDRATFSSFEHDNEIYSFAAVLDGHGGINCSEYVKRIVGGHLKASFSDENAWENCEQTMIETFHAIDREFCERAVRKRDYSGACATIVVQKGDELVVGNIGDCRAILVPVSKTGAYLAPVEITVDHRADSTAENLRINAAGGKVLDGRVMTLQPSRSFGDIDVKLAAGKDVVIASPDVDKIFIRRQDPKNKKKTDNRPFMILATDGVWDFINNKQATNLIKGILKKSKGKSSFRGLKKTKSKASVHQTNTNIAETCAEALVRKAQDAGSDDDTTAVVMIF